MKYIYDIILNFNDTFIDFFDWNDEDSIDYIKRIPIFKVSNKVINDIKNNKVIFEDFTNTISNKCEVYMKDAIGIIEYACLFCSKDYVIAIEFNYKGASIFKSDLLIDESLDIIEYCKRIKPINFNYKIISKETNNFMTRKEQKMIKFIKNELKNIVENNNIDKIKYLYYECFKKTENNLLRMNSGLEKHMFKNPNKLFNILMLSYSKH